MSNTTVFVRLRFNYDLRDITDSICGNLGGDVSAESADRLGLIADIPKENLERLREYTAILRVYDGKIPESTVRGYDPALKFLAGIHNRSFNRQPTQATPDEAQRLRETMYRGA